MKESIYACLFSSGLIKVGRSIDPSSRMATHAERVSCTGVEMVDTHHAKCNISGAESERLLIEKCRSFASNNHKSEWFDGLDFEQVKIWVDDSSQIVKRVDHVSEVSMWASVIIELKASGLKQKEIALIVGTNDSQISELLSGKIKNPYWNVGDALLELHASRVAKRAA